MRWGNDNPRMIRIARLLPAGLLAALLAPGRALAQGCAMCGTALKDSNDPLTRSMTTSTLFMISMPFFLFFSVAGWFVYRYWRAAGSVAKETPR